MEFVIFWLLVFFARSELGIKGVVLAVAVWCALVAGSFTTDISPNVFIAGHVLLDIVLVLTIFGRDIRIR